MVLHHHDSGKAQRQLLMKCTVKTVSLTRFLLLEKQMRTTLKKIKIFSKKFETFETETRERGYIWYKSQDQRAKMKLPAVYDEI